MTRLLVALVTGAAIGPLLWSVVVLVVVIALGLGVLIWRTVARQQLCPQHGHRTTGGGCPQCARRRGVSTGDEADPLTQTREPRRRHRAPAAASFLIFGLMICSVDRASAQDATDLTASLKVQQQQIDQLQTLLMTRTGLADPRFFVTLDPIERNYDLVAVLTGWGFGCTGRTPGRVDVMVDGVVVKTNAYLERFDRQDVIDWATLTGQCLTTPLQSGLFGSVDLTKYAPGDHRIQFIIRDADGLMKKSNERVFTVPLILATVRR